MTKDQKSPGPQAFQRDQVVSIINSVINKVNSPQAVSREVVSKELAELKEIIESLRHELSAARPADIGDMHIPSATDELDAIVGTTEQATNTIMSACETILEKIGPADEGLAKTVEAEIIRIYEACTFQDVTGQRITKVVKTLKTIDQKVSHLLQILTGQLVSLGVGEQSLQNVEEEGNVDKLLNGPALPGQAVTQEEIDKLLADFGN